MSLHPEKHAQFRHFISTQNWNDAQSLWLELAEQPAAAPEALLLLVQELAAAGQERLAAELVSLLTLSLRSAGKLHEWLYALKLQAAAMPKDKALRAELIEAYREIYKADLRLPSILNVAELDQPTAPLPAAIARVDALLALNVGAFCQHKSWGFGRVKLFDAPLNRLVVSFPHNPDHAFQFPYAAESLAPVTADHIEVRKATDLDTLKKLATAEPLSLLRIVLASHNRALTSDRIEPILAGSVIPVADWKKWWENAKKLAKRDPHFEVPAKKVDPVILRAAPVSRHDELAAAFRDARALSQKTDVARQLLLTLDELQDPELLIQEFQDGLIEAIRASKPSGYIAAVEAALTVDELRTHQRTPSGTSTPFTLEIFNKAGKLAPLLEELSTPAQKRAVAILKESDPNRLIAELNNFPAKILDEIGDTLAGSLPRLTQIIQNHTASPELLVWLSRNVATADWLIPLQNPELLLAILSALEDAPAKPAKRLREVLFNEETLLTDLLASASAETIRDISRRILNHPNIEELDRRSLMARLVKEFPFVQQFIVTKTVKEQPLLVSWTSLRRRQEELADIVEKRIPANSKEIGVARSYGDLRENFEFKAAKDTQKLLMRRRGELELLLLRAQGTDFADVKTDVVGIGNSVTVTDLATGQPVTYHILGAWDSDPARGIISYPAALAQVLLNKKPGETVTAAGETGTIQFRIDRVEKVPAEILQSL